MKTQSKYYPAIGIECHVQLKTKTKLFSTVRNDARSAAPNSLISHIDAGLPGALPVLNEAAVKMAVKAAHALNTTPEKFSKFDRKHYFYPDLPKGYQITQYDQPIIAGGYVEITIGQNTKKIRITRVNLEEDAGKTTHPPGANYSLVDLNRAGTPLLEIVSEPDISSPQEAKAYVRELWLLMKYAGVTDGDLYHGHVRFDVNTSISLNPDNKGTRSEVKNLNSFRSVEAAVVYEIERQVSLLEKGGVVVQETRGWDEVKQKTLPQRQKEEAHDYRYFPEPDIPPLELEVEAFKDSRDNLSPNKIRAQLAALDLKSPVVEDILDKFEIVPTILKAIVELNKAEARRVAFNLLENDKASQISPDDLFTISKAISSGRLYTTAATSVINSLASEEGKIEDLIEKNAVMTDTAEIEDIVDKVISENPKAANDIKNGEQKAIGFLVGQIMQKTKGKADPLLVQKLLKEKLQNL